MAARIQSRAMLSSLSRSSGVSACAASCTQSRAKASNSFAAEPDDMGSRLHGAPSSTVALSSLEFQEVPSNPASSLCELRAALRDYQGVGALRARLWAAASIGTTPARGSRRRGVAGALWGATSGPRRPVRWQDVGGHLGAARWRTGRASLCANSCCQCVIWGPFSAPPRPLQSAKGAPTRPVNVALPAWQRLSTRGPVRKADLEFPVRRSVQPAARLRA
jgi:hypothetical protein